VILIWVVMFFSPCHWIKCPNVKGCYCCCTWNRLLSFKWDWHWW